MGGILTTTENDQIAAAVAALRTRGVNTAEGLLEHATPEQILTACHRWDSQTGVGPGLLAQWIRTGQFLEPEPEAPPTPREQLQAKFERYAARYPVGTIIEPHRVLDARRWPEWANDPPCTGNMVVVDTNYPVLALQCDQCRFETGISPRPLQLLDQWAGS